MTLQPLEKLILLIDEKTSPEELKLLLQSALIFIIKIANELNSTNAESKTILESALEHLKSKLGDIETMMNDDSALQSLRAETQKTLNELIERNKDREDEIANVIQRGLETERTYVNQLAGKMTHEQRKDIALLHEAIKKVQRIPGPPGIPGEKGDPGKDAVIDEEKIISTLVARLPRNEYEQNIEELKKRIEELEKQKLTLGSKIGWGSHPLTIKGSGTTKHKNARIINFTGGTVTTSADGTINVATGGGGFTELTATGTINGVNVTFTFTSAPTYIISDGAWYKENQGFTLSGTTATMVIPPQFSIFGVA